MRHTPVVSIVVAALAALPGQGTAQRALKDHQFWAAPRVYEQRDIAWKLSAPLTPSTPLKPTVRLTVFRAALPAPPRLSWRQSDVALAGAFTVALRSEERRVGKECRSRWS